MLFLISCVLAVIGMFLSFFGITHENFTKHPKQIKVLKWIVGSTFIPVVVFAWLENSEIDKKNNIQYETIIRLKTIDSTSQAQIDSLRKDSKISQKEYVDSIINYHNYTTELLAKYGFRVDTLNKTLEKLSDKVIKEMPPTLAILNKPLLYTKDTLGSYMIDLTFILTALNANVHLTDAYYITIPIRGDTLCNDITIRPFQSLNYSEVIPFTGDGSNMYLPFSVPKTLDRFALVFNFEYKSKGGKQQTPLRKAYMWNIKDHSLKIAQSYQFGMIGQHLKKKNIWPILYDL